MTDVEFYTRIINTPCEGCDAYENLGHCGTWWSSCVIPKFHNFLREMCWDEEYFLDLIIFEDIILPEQLLEEDYEEYLKELAQGEYIEGMWDYEDEPFCYM